MDQIDSTYDKLRLATLGILARRLGVAKLHADRPVWIMLCILIKEGRLHPTWASHVNDIGWFFTNAKEQGVRGNRGEEQHFCAWGDQLASLLNSF